MTFLHQIHGSSILIRVSSSNNSYGLPFNGLETGCLRTSSTSYNMFAAHHGNGSTTRFDDRTFAVDGTMVFTVISSDGSTSV